jgi:hypothetical protein
MTDAPATNELLGHFPLQYSDGPDYCTVKDATGADFALTVQPDLMRLMEDALRAAATPSAQGASLLPDASPGNGAEKVREAALGLLAAEDERQSKLHELLETIREQIRLEVKPEHRPEGLFKNIQDAVYAMRGRTALLNDAAIIAALHSTSAAGETTSSADGVIGKDGVTYPDTPLGRAYAGIKPGPSEATTADVLAMKEACKRAVTELDCMYVNDMRVPYGGIPADPESSAWREAIKAAEAAIDNLSPEVKAEGGHGEPVAIKPLKWRDHRPDSFPEPAWSAQTPFGFYNIEEVSASDSPRYVVRLHAHHFVADKDSLDEAKEAAQADYGQRIRSALGGHPASPPDVDAIRADERERCARVVEQFGQPYALNTNTGAMMFRAEVGKIASAIRTGGQK